MNFLATFVKRLVSVLHRDHYFEELQEEMEFHIASRAEKYIDSGVTPSEAFAAARKEFGNSTLLQERAWFHWAFTWVDEAIHDIRYAIRMLFQNKGWTIVAVLSLSLGIGANIAIFSVFDALLLRSLPVKNPDELISLRGQYQYPFFQAIASDGVLKDVFASAGIDEQDIEIDNRAVGRTPLSLVSGSYFSTLGVPAAIGRTFDSSDDEPNGTNSVAVLSYGFWRRRFSSEPSVIGKSIRIRGVHIAIIGVTAPGFLGEQVGSAPDLWLPLTLWPQVVPGRNLLQSPGTAWLNIIARRRPDVADHVAAVRLTAVFRRVLTDIFGAAAPGDTRREIAQATVRLAPGDRGMSRLREQFSKPLYVIFSGVALMLLIACANVANLLLARSTARRREISVRLALGVTRLRLLRQLLTENLLLSALSATVGAAIAYWGNAFLLRLASTTEAPLPIDTPINGRLLVFVVALTVMTAILFGLAPLWRMTHADLAASLRSRGGLSNRFRVGSSLVVIQV